MPLYTFTSPFSVNRIAGRFVVIDTSYLIAISDSSEDLSGTISAFHNTALAKGSIFFMNVVARQEFIKWVRKTQLLTAMVELAKVDAAIDSRYRTILKNAVPNFATPLEERHLKTRFDALHKSHVLAGDVSELKKFLMLNIWQEVQRLEAQARINYFSGAGKISWDSLGLAMQKYGTDAPDSMIVNFAFSINAKSIVTTDCDYAQFVADIDVYMPETIAKVCAAYSPQIDNQP